MNSACTTTPSDKKVVSDIWFVSVCFLLSGFSALVYQVAWLKLFSVVFGTSEMAVVTVLAAYMGGLACGAAIIRHRVGSIKAPLLVYGLLEIFIAVFALGMPLILNGLESFHISVLGMRDALPAEGGLESLLFYVGTGFLILVVPTALMGATLPLLVRDVVHTDQQVGSRVSALYAINTLGAAAGAWAAGFALMPNFGVRHTIQISALINLIIFALVIFRHFRYNLGQLHLQKPAVADRQRKSQPTPTFRSNIFSSHAIWILPGICISGFASFGYEILWTRLLSHVLGGSIYAFSTMLGTFLVGIALGGALAGKLAKDREQSTFFFMLVQLGIALTSILMYLLIDQLIPDNRNWASQLLFCVMVMLPSTIFIGMTFPLAVRILSPDEVGVAENTAKVYMWNTVGAIGGAIVTGYYIIPQYGFNGTIHFNVMINVLLMGTWFLVEPRRKLLRLIPASLCIILVTVGFHPQRPDLLVNPYLIVGNQREVSSIERYYGVGRTATVFMGERGDHFELSTNGLPEASIAFKGAVPSNRPQKWLTALPILARPDARSLLLIGFGGGVSLENLPPTLTDIDVVEIEPEVIKANASIADTRGFNPLADQRINVVINDARGALKLTNKLYPIIVSQPSHPWTSGSSHFYTTEFYEIVKKNLDKQGLFLQWLSWNFIDGELLVSTVATLKNSFEHVHIFQPSPDVLHFLASDAPINLDAFGLVENFGDMGSFLNELGVMSVEDILVTEIAGEALVEEMANRGRVITDDFNTIQFESKIHQRDDHQQALFAKLEEFGPEQIYGEFEARLVETEASYPNSIMILLRRGLESYARKIVSHTSDPLNKNLGESLLALHEGNGEGMEQFALQALKLDQSNEIARYLLLRKSMGSIASKETQNEVEVLASGLPASARAVVLGWWFAARNEWRLLSQLEATLASAQTSDIWYSNAALLRAEWRTRVKTPNLRERMNREALEIVDDGIRVEPNVNLLIVRFLAARNIQNYSYLLGTTETLVDIFGKIGGSDAPGEDNLGAQLVGIQSILGKYEFSPEYQERYLKVTRSIDRILEGNKSKTE